MIKNFIIPLFLCLVAYTQVNAENINSISHYYPFLSQGFNMDSYQKCKDLLDKCPIDNLFPDQGCIKNILRTKKVCIQLGKVRQILNDVPIVKQINIFTIFALYHRGDGQHEYYILSKGNLFSTTIDPRLLDKDFAKKYKEASFFIVNWNAPRYSTNADGLHKFIVLLKITENCLACPIIGWTTIGFNFSKEGVLLRIKLDKFNSGVQPPI